MNLASRNAVQWSLCLAGFCDCVTSARADDLPFSAGKASQDTATALEKYHITHRPLNDHLSVEWFAAFLERLDPQRMYFQEIDVAEFRPFERRLDDLAKDSDFQFARLVQKRYRERVIDAVAMAVENLDLAPDFTLDEQMPVRFESFSRNNSEQRERWRQRVKLELLLEKLHGRDMADVKQQLRERYHRIARQARAMTDERLCQIYLDALVSRYDAASCYLSESYFASFSQTYSFGTFALGLNWQERRGRYFIKSVNPALDTQRWAGLIGWEILAIQRDGGAIYDVVEMHYEEFGDLIRSPFGPLKSACHVTLELLHPVTFERRTVPWTRFQYKW
jgi:carboxyl-terminal processing protease